MRILVISPIFPPIADSEAICGGKFVQALIDSGVEPLVIVCTNVRSAERWDTSKYWSSVEAVSIDLPSQRRISTIHRCLLVLRYQSSSWVEWTQSVVSKAQEIHRHNPFDLIVSRALPRHSHMVGYWVASALRIPWVANVNDPWDFTPFQSNKRNRNETGTNLNWRFWWRRIEASADAIAFPCERLRDYCLQNSRRKSGNIIVPHIGMKSETLRGKNEFHMVHAGKIGVNEWTERSAEALLGGVAELFNRRAEAKGLTRLLLVGPEDPVTMKRAEDLGLNENVSSTGWVNYEKSLEYIAGAVICVLLEGNYQEGVFLPSKLCDYIAARKPVLALSPEVGTVNDLSREGGILRVRPNDPKGVAAALVELFDAFNAKRLESYAPPESLVRRFEAKTIINGFLGSVASLTKMSALKTDFINGNESVLGKR